MGGRSKLGWGEMPFVSFVHFVVACLAYAPYVWSLPYKSAIRLNRLRFDRTY